MSKILGFTAIGLSIVLMSHTDPAPDPASGIKWLTWQEATELSKAKPKKIFVDIYTDWCGWCKKMDATTFNDAKVVNYMNENFYAVKFNAEMKDEIRFNNHTFKWVEAGRNGIHTLAYSLLEGKMSYPSFVTLNESFDRIAIMPGFKQPEQLMLELKFAAEEVYRDKSWDEYRANN
jgi:thioredoxin-related protein